MRNAIAPPDLPGADCASARSLYVQPGMLVTSVEPAVVTTVLGSCVSVCLWDAGRGIGGLNHYLMPHGEGVGSLALRFGNLAIRELIARLRLMGSRDADLRAKIFGGADVLDAFRGGEDSLGAKNVEVARTMLRERGIPIQNEAVRGRQGLKLIFHTHDGQAFVRRLGTRA